jgi:CPA2 family monovalent cation:H+ antiporter-2
MEADLSSVNHHLPVFIHDLAVILVTAGVTSVLFRWLKQPAVLGYLVAGVLVGPHFSFFPTISDTESVKLWGEIGVLFVLFSLGLEFSFRRLLRIGGTAAVTALVEVSTTFMIGALLAYLLGWRDMNVVFWGGMFCICSTSIILKVFQENGLKGRHFAQVVMGVLIVEDLVAILLLVMLSTVAITRQVSGGELLWATGRLMFFLTLWFAVGLLVLPTAIRYIRRLLTDETALIVSVGLCLLMVLIATGSGFSPALGAFVMGSLLAESPEGTRVEKLLHPVRDFFAAVFFVSVGMLFDPANFASTWHLVVALSIALIISKTVAATIGGLLSGQTLNTSLRAGLSLTQIGEFSFIIAGLGMSLKVIDSALYPMAVGVSILTCFISPYLIRYSDQIAGFVERNLPRRTREMLATYQHAVHREKGTRLVPLLLRAYGPLTVINLVLLVTTTWLMRHLVYPQLIDIFGNATWLPALAVSLDLLVCLPFFYGLSYRRPRLQVREQLEKFPSYRWARLSISVCRATIGAVLFFVVIGQYVSWRALSSLAVAAFLALGFVFFRYGGTIYRNLEGRYLGHLGGGRKDDEKGEKVLPWNQHLSEVVVEPDSPLAGMTLAQIGPQESFGVMVAAIDRGQRRLLAPKANDQIFPLDRLQVLGSEDGIDRIRKLAELTEPPIIEGMPLKLQSVVLLQGSPVIGRSLRDSDIRSLVDGLVVGIERDGLRQLHPNADLRLEDGDRLWIVGDPDKIHRLNGE